MHPNNFSQAVKWVLRLTEKARVAVDETTTMFSWKQKPSDSRAGSAATATAAQDVSITVVKKTKPGHDGEGQVDKPPHATTQQGKHVGVKSEDNNNAPPANQVEIKSDGQKSHSPSSDKEEDPKTSLVYAFFDPILIICEIDKHYGHEFKCQAHACKAKICQFLDTKDAWSTGNMQKCVKSCWDGDVLGKANATKDAKEVCMKIVGSILQTRSITAAFERKGKGKMTYSHQQHTHAKAR